MAVGPEEPRIDSHAAVATPRISKVRLCANDGGGPNGIRTLYHSIARSRRSHWERHSNPVRSSTEHGAAPQWTFSNLKTWLLGTHHGSVKKQHMQAYLNEFTFRFNRRQTPMAACQTVLGLIGERQGPTYEGLYAI